MREEDEDIDDQNNKPSPGACANEFMKIYVGSVLSRSSSRKVDSCRSRGFFVFYDRLILEFVLADDEDGVDGADNDDDEEGGLSFAREIHVRVQFHSIARVVL